MTFTRWLRENSERYLLDAARQEVGVRYGARSVRPDDGVLPLFWRRVFVPAYRVLPWRLRLAVIRAMPGSHRQEWHTPPPPRGPAV